MDRLFPNLLATRLLLSFRRPGALPPKTPMRSTMLRPLLALPALALACPLAQAQLPWGTAETDLAIQAATPDPSDQFGFSVDLDGDLAVVGAPGDDDAGSSAGAVYVLSRNLGGAGAWGQAQKLIAGDALAADLLGAEVSIGGNLVMAHSYQTVLGTYHRAVYLFDASTGAQVAKLIDGDTAVTTFGRAIDTDGVHAVVGMGYNAPGPGTNQGRVAVFDAAGNLSYHLSGSDTDQDDQFGLDVSVDGAYIAVSAPQKENGGAVYVFDAATGAELHKLVGTGVTPGDNFGREVDVDGGRVLVAGAAEAFVFDLATGAQLWQLDGEGFNVPGFATHVALADDWAYIGSSSTVFPGFFQGRVMQVCLDTGLTNVELHNVAPMPGILSRDALAADGSTVISGDAFSGSAGFNSEGLVNLMTTAGLGLSIDKDLIALPDSVTLTLRGSLPAIPAGLALTAVNGVPIPPAIFLVAPASALGELVAGPLPVAPALSGLTLEVTGGGLTKAGVLALSNPVELQIL